MTQRFKKWSACGTAFAVGLTLVASLTTALAATTSSGQGLWGGIDLPPCSADGKDCVDPVDGVVKNVTDTKPVELGVKFQASKPITVVGVRFYKGSENIGQHTGTVWDKDGNMLATATFTNETATGWQDVTFATPVAIGTADTFIASYFAPNGGYAYQWQYFTNSGYTVDPVTAQQSIQGDGNGVFNYDQSTFPQNTFRDMNYWVTPLWTPQFTLSGFFQPVDMGTMVNTVKGGSTVPLKFRVFWGVTEQRDVSVVDRFRVTREACPGADAIEEFTTTGGTGLRYDTSSSQFIQNWKTPNNAGSCYEVTMLTTDGSSISAHFKLR